MGSLDELIDKRSKDNNIDKRNKKSKEHPNTNSLPKIEHVIKFLHGNAELVVHVVCVAGQAVFLL